MSELFQFQKLTKTELDGRMSRFREKMDSRCPEWEAAVLFTGIHIYYFTGTMQKGMLYIPREGCASLWVHRSFERARHESNFEPIYPMTSYAQPREAIGNITRSVHIEANQIPIGFMDRFKRYFPYEQIEGMDDVLMSVRSVKSTYELNCLRRSGEIHKKVLEDIVPSLLRLGMSEAELAWEIGFALNQEGHQGIARLGMFDSEVGMGYIGFGDSSIFPTAFTGPGGNLGNSPAVPLSGNPHRKLKAGDLIFVDVGCGYEGYNTDKTMNYVFRGQLPDDAYRLHEQCVEIQNRVAAMLRPGRVPSEIYDEIVGSLDEGFLRHFMGYGAHRVKFLGHSIGLWIDETPVIAKGFDEPLEQNMVFAVEPKQGIEGIGMVGIENTFICDFSGGISITGEHPGLLHVK